MFSQRKVFITGANGSLGTELVNVFKKNNIITNGHFHKQEDVKNPDNVFGDIQTF